LHLHEILVFCPNLNLKVVLDDVEFKQFPFWSVNENELLPPINKSVEDLYPL
jgi:hypothetical protein